MELNYTVNELKELIIKQQDKIFWLEKALEAEMSVVKFERENDYWYKEYMALRAKYDQLLGNTENKAEVSVKEVLENE